MYMSAVCMRRENNIKSKVMNYDLIELAKRCPDLAITVRLADLVEANRGLIEETKRELAKSMEACREMKSQIKELNGISADVKHLVDDINLIRNIQTETRSEIMNRINETSTDFYSQNRKIVVLLMLILFCIISIIIFEMLY